MTYPPLAIEINKLRSLLRYDEQSGHLYWVGKSHPRSPIKIGALAGQEKGGYIYIGIMGKKLLAHRIAWAIKTGKWPTKIIDHKDLNGANNRWANLRLATRSQNRANSSTKRTLPKGVYKNSNSNNYSAVIIHNYHRLHLGTFHSVAAASAAYMQAANKFHNEFARAK